MHGSPLSKYDNRDLWKKYNYKDLGIVAEPYFDIDFTRIFYLTDTGRRWDGEKVSVRDKVSRQWAVGSEQSAVGSRQWAVGSRQSAVGSQQSAVSSQQWAVGSGQWAVGSRHPFSWYLSIVEDLSIVEERRRGRGMR